MEWISIFLVILLILLVTILGIVFACVLSGEGCTLSIQQRSANPQLTKIQQEEEVKRQNKFSSKLKRAFNSSPELEPPLPPVEDVKTIEFKFKLANEQNNSEQITTVDESSTIPLQKPRNFEAERAARRKRQEAMRRKYNL